MPFIALKKDVVKQIAPISAKFIIMNYLICIDV